MTQQAAPAEESIYDLPMSSQILLRSSSMTEDELAKLREHNDDTGFEIDIVDNNAMSLDGRMAARKVKAKEAFIEYEGSYSKKKKHNWLEQVQNQRTKKFFNLDDLVKHGIIEDDERSLFDLPLGTSDFPYRQITQLHRVQTNQGEFLNTHEMWVGVGKGANVVSLGIDDMHYFIKPVASYELITTDGRGVVVNQRDIDSNTIRLARTRVAPSGELHGTKQWITKFTPNVVKSALKCIRGVLGDNNNGCSMTLVKENDRRSVSVSTLDEFLHPSFNDVYERNSRSAPTFTDFLSGLKEKMDKDRKDADEQSQYT